MPRKKLGRAISLHLIPSFCTADSSPWDTLNALVSERTDTRRQVLAVHSHAVKKNYVDSISINRGPERSKQETFLSPVAPPSDISR